MKNFIVFLMILFWFKGFTVTLYGQKYFQIHADSPNVPDDNVTLLGMWTSGSCNGVFVEGNYAYIIKRATIEILDGIIEYMEKENMVEISSLTGTLHAG